MITCINHLLTICLVKGMVLEDGKEHLDYLLQKSFRYEHHLKNYEESLKTGLIPNGLSIFLYWYSHSCNNEKSKFVKKLFVNLITVVVFYCRYVIDKDVVESFYK